MKPLDQCAQCMAQNASTPKSSLPFSKQFTSRVAKRDDFHSKLLFFVKNKGQWNAKSGPKVADGNVAMRTKFSGRLESK